jgi:hypothetical protein
MVLIPFLQLLPVRKELCNCTGNKNKRRAKLAQIMKDELKPFLSDSGPNMRAIFSFGRLEKGILPFNILDTQKFPCSLLV